jgi:hypothetical protein
MVKCQLTNNREIHNVGAGFIVLIIGIFTDAYEFWVGVIAALAIWIVSGALSTWIGVKK